MLIVDLVVVVCAELTNDFTNQLAKRMGVKPTSNKELPLSSQRDGMRSIEGAVALIVESEDHAKKSWISGSVKNECFHLLAPDVTMRTLKEAFIETIDSVGLQPSQIDWLSLHATGTRVWDPLEIGLVKKIFSKNIPHLSAFKRSFGHGRSTGCLMAAAMIVEGLKSQRLPILPQDIIPVLI